jgi:hypothetical protein
VSEGGILRLPPIQLREVGSREAATTSTSYPRRTHMLVSKGGISRLPPIKLREVGQREAIAISTSYLRRTPCW